MQNDGGLSPISMTQWRSQPQAFADALHASFVRFGFAVVRDHGLDAATIERATSAAEAFFAAPLQRKQPFLKEGQAGARGYTPFRVETAKGATRADLKEFWHVGRDLPAGHPSAAVMPPNVWPDEPAEFRPAVSALFSAMDSLGMELLAATAMGLHLPSDWFGDKAGVGDSILRLAHYPPVEDGDAGVRAAAHEDINVITLLLGAEEPGLQILARDGRWLAVNPPPGHLVVNVGDMLQRLTNHVLPSTTHRVVNPPAERRRRARLSTPFFVHFNPDFEIRTLASCIGDQDRYPQPITAHAFLQQRLREIGLKKELIPSSTA